MNISILLPTRGRPHNVARLQASLRETVADPSALELWMFIDDDDPTAEQIETTDAFAVHQLRGARRPMAEMFAACYARSLGRVVMLAGDDVVFRTPGWDERVLAAVERFPEGIGLVYGNDLLKGMSLCTHPLLPRATADLLGAPCPREYPGEYIDTHLFDTFAKLRALGEDRIAYLDDVVIEHMHYSVGKAPHDSTYAQSAPTPVCRAIFERLEGEREETARVLRRRITEARG